MHWYLTVIFPNDEPLSPVGELAYIHGSYTAAHFTACHVMPQKDEIEIWEVESGVRLTPDAKPVFTTCGGVIGDGPKHVGQEDNNQKEVFLLTYQHKNKFIEILGIAPEEDDLRSVASSVFRDCKEVSLLGVEEARTLIRLHTGSIKPVVVYRRAVKKPVSVK